MIIEKRTLIFGAIFIVIGVIIGLGIASNVDETLPWHSLDQLAKSQEDLTKVDDNANGIVDDSDNLAGKTSTEIVDLASKIGSCSTVFDMASNPTKNSAGYYIVNLPSNACVDKLCYLITLDSTGTPQRWGQYIQISSQSNIWMASVTHGGGLNQGKNGDSAEEQIMILPGGAPLADDTSSSSGGDQVPTSWAIKGSPSKGTKLLACG